MDAQTAETQVLRDHIHQAEPGEVLFDELAKVYLRGVSSVLDKDQQERKMICQLDVRKFVLVLSSEVFQMRTRIEFLEERNKELQDTIKGSQACKSLRKGLRKVRKAISNGLASLNRKITDIKGDSASTPEDPAYVRGLRDLVQYAGIIDDNRNLNVSSEMTSSRSHSFADVLDDQISEYDSGKEFSRTKGKRMRKNTGIDTEPEEEHKYIELRSIPKPLMERDLIKKKAGDEKRRSAANNRSLRQDASPTEEVQGRLNTSVGDKVDTRELKEFLIKRASGFKFQNPKPGEIVDLDPVGAWVHGDNGGTLVTDKYSEEDIRGAINEVNNSVLRTAGIGPQRDEKPKPPDRGKVEPPEDSGGEIEVIRSKRDLGAMKAKREALTNEQLKTLANDMIAKVRARRQEDHERQLAIKREKGKK